VNLMLSDAMSRHMRNQTMNGALNYPSNWYDGLSWIGVLVGCHLMTMIPSRHCFPSRPRLV
jgi:hypothetical protein